MTMRTYHYYLYKYRCTNTKLEASRDFFQSNFARINLPKTYYTQFVVPTRKRKMVEIIKGNCRDFKILPQRRI